MPRTTPRTPKGITLLHHHPLPSGLAVDMLALDNGLTLLIMEDHQAPVAAYQTWFSVGSGDEQPGLTGMAHLFEHLMFKETANLKEGEFDRLLEHNGVSSNAATWLDWTYYKENLPADKLDLVMRLEADRMENMTLNQEQLAAEREVVKNERRLRVDNDPEGLLEERLFATHFGHHPYGHPTIGWMEDIDRITLPDCIRFRSSSYSPANACVVVVGDVETGQVLQLARKYYRHIPARPAPPRLPARLGVRRRERRQTLTLPLQSPRLLLLYPAPAATHPDGPALRVLSEIFVNLESARLRRLLVDDLQLASDLGASWGDLARTGFFEIQVNLVPGAHPLAALDRLDRELLALARSGCPRDETERGRNRIEMSFLRTSMHVAARARNLGNAHTTTRDFRHYFRSLPAVQAVTPDDLPRVAATWLRPERRTCVIALPDHHKE